MFLLASGAQFDSNYSLRQGSWWQRQLWWSNWIIIMLIWVWSPSVISRPFKKWSLGETFPLVATVLCQNVWFRGNISENRVVLVQWDRCVRSSGRCPLRLDGLNDFCHHDPRRINNHSSCLSLIIGAAAEIIFHSWLSGELQSPAAGSSSG